MGTSQQVGTTGSPQRGHWTWSTGSVVRPVSPQYSQTQSVELAVMGAIFADGGCGRVRSGVHLQWFRGSSHLNQPGRRTSPTGGADVRFVTRVTG